MRVNLLLVASAVVIASPVMAAPDPAMQAAIANIAAAADTERQAKAIPSIAIALVDRSGVIWSRAFGTTDAAGKLPATAATLYRAGSVSKLFSDIAVMRLVEAGKLDLDAPVTRYLPNFTPHNPFGGAITLRQLMTHRSGLVREPPRGHYFDDQAKGQADAVASLSATTLVAAPGTLTKYSNAGIAVVGEVVAAVTGKPFAAAVDDLVLAPLGMAASGFGRENFDQPASASQLASFDGGRWAAPLFDLGTPAAGSLYTNVGDLGLFMRAILNTGALPAGRLLTPASLAEMWRPQYPVTPGARQFGLGFVLGNLDGARTVGHTGAVYGHATDLRLLPDAGLGVIVFSTVDSGPSAQRLAGFALASIAAARTGKPLPRWLATQPITGAEATRLAGRYVDGADSVNLRVGDGRLLLDAPEFAGEVRTAGGRPYIDDAQAFRDTIAIAADGQSLSLAGRRFTRSDWPRPAPPTPELAALIGEYGWDYNVLRIYERDGQPYVRIEWTDWLPLKRLAPDTFAFPVNRGLYPLETLVFERGKDGRVTAAMLGAIRFPRRDFGAEAEAGIRAKMQTGIDALRVSAKAATPPAEPPAAQPSSLTALTSIDPGIRLDIRYAGTNNFMGQQIYEAPGAFLQRPAAEAVGRVHRKLHAAGYGLLIHDAYRPWYVTKMFWDATPPANRMFVADPSQGSRHNRGAAVDLTMYGLADGKPIHSTGRYDEFSSRSYANYFGGSDLQRWQRDLLRRTMESEGFTVYPEEWWHFDLVGWQDYAIGNDPFDAIRAATPFVR